MTYLQKAVLGFGGLAAVILLLGWTLPEPGRAGSTGEYTEGKVCTLVGCASSLQIDLKPLKRAMPDARRATLCVDGNCRTFSLKNPARLRVGVNWEGGKKSAKVRLVTKGKGGKVLRRDSIKAGVVVSRPNGKDCPPACYFVRAKLRSRDGRLIALPQV